jgi:Domain of unknown function (DUF4365)
MPRRTRGHQLEKQSRLAFEHVLGDRFVFRSEEPDYGVDGSVEVFDPSLGYATGLRFFAQLKATDEVDLKKALRLWVSLETADYYRALPLPLLMVRYQASSGRLFTRWFHQFDPYYGGLGKRDLRSAGRKTMFGTPNAQTPWPAMSAHSYAGDPRPYLSPSRFGESVQTKRRWA